MNIYIVHLFLELLFVWFLFYKKLKQVIMRDILVFSSYEDNIHEENFLICYLPWLDRGQKSFKLQSF